MTAKRPKKKDVVYVVRDATNGEQRPQVTIDKSARGEYVYGVRVTGRTLAEAVERAKDGFTALQRYAQHLDARDIAERLRKSVQGK